MHAHMHVQSKRERDITVFIVDVCLLLVQIQALMSYTAIFQELAQFNLYVHRGPEPKWTTTCSMCVCFFPRLLVMSRHQIYEKLLLKPCPKFSPPHPDTRHQAQTQKSKRKQRPAKCLGLSSTLSMALAQRTEELSLHMCQISFNVIPIYFVNCYLLHSHSLTFVYRIFL